VTRQDAGDPSTTAIKRQKSVETAARRPPCSGCYSGGFRENFICTLYDTVAGQLAEAVSRPIYTSKLFAAIQQPSKG